MSTHAHHLHALSRFFFARSGSELRSAWSMFEDAPPVSDWDALEFSFNALFVGPAAVKAPPYASVYLDGSNRQVMGQSTLQIRDLYQAVGLSSPWLNQIPDDHIALELDALWQLTCANAQVPSAQLNMVLDYLRDHLQRWVPMFVEKIHSVPKLGPAFVFVTDCLLGTLQAPSASPQTPSLV